MSIENSSNSSPFCPTARRHHATKSLIQNHIQICDKHIKFIQKRCWKLRYLSNSKIFRFFDLFTVTLWSNQRSHPKKIFIFVFNSSILVRKLIIVEKKNQKFFHFFFSAWKKIKIFEKSLETPPFLNHFSRSIQIYAGFCCSLKDGWTYNLTDRQTDKTVKKYFFGDGDAEV